MLRLESALLAAMALLLCGCGSSSNVISGTPPRVANELLRKPQPLAHIIVFVQENRSFDHYMGLLGKYRQIVHHDNTTIDTLNLSTPVKTAAGGVFLPYHLATQCTGNPELTPEDPLDELSVGYYDWTDLPYYYELFYQYSTSDQFYSAVNAETPANRMMLMAATTGGYLEPPNIPGGWTKPTIFDHLSEAGVTWRYYNQSADAPFIDVYRTAYKYPKNIVNISQYFTDIQSPSTMPQVMFIERWPGLDEHPLFNVQKGAHRAATIINAFLNSPAYESSAFILTYDERGYFYDSAGVISTVPPADAPELIISGYRVPVVVISPWAKAHYVSHVKRDATSILKFIENKFNVPPLTARDAAAPDLAEMFDFTSPEIAVPPPLPEQPTDGVCNLALQLDPTQ